MPDDLPAWKRDWILFWSYIRITSIVVGGGYAIIAAAQEEFVTRRQWLSEDDVLEMITVTQTVPGILACNSAVCIGWRIDRWRGAVAALCGATLPSLVIILLVAGALTRYREILALPAVRGAFRGVIAGIVGMVAVTALRLRPKAVKDCFGGLVAAAGFAGLCVFNLAPAWLIAGAILAGWLLVLYQSLKSRSPR